MANRDMTFLEKIHAVDITEGVEYGHGVIGFKRGGSVTKTRPLLLDVYAPADVSGALRPALILAFGGAFQRGTRKDDVVGDPPHRNTAISEYCMEFARRGYVCFSINYRLMPEAPDPGDTPTWINGTGVNVDRANFVRKLIGLEPCTQEMMIEAHEAGTDDFSLAIEFVREHAGEYGIDPAKIGVGGFSAGATIAINAAYAMYAPVAAVVAISGRMTLSSAKAYICEPATRPPLFMSFAENDLAGTLEDLGPRTDHLKCVGLHHRIVHVPGATHFYPRTSPVTQEDGSTTDLESAIALFLSETLTEK
jgi:acetyl esterase/lipase